MSTLGVILALAAVSLQGNAAVEGPLDPGPPLWGDDVLVWNMQNSLATWLGPGPTNCDLILVEDTLFAVAVRRSELISFPAGFRSSDGGYSWSPWFSSSSSTINYDPELHRFGDYIFVFFAARNGSSTGFPKMYRYDYPSLENFTLYNLDWPTEADTIAQIEVVTPSSEDSIWLFAKDIQGDVYGYASDGSGLSWSEPVFLESHVGNIHAISTPDNYVYLAFNDLAENQIKVVRFSSDWSSDIYSVGPAANNAAPIMDYMSSKMTQLVLAYHNNTNTVTLAFSTDSAQSWSVEELYNGFYPWVDVAENSSLSCLSHVKGGGYDVMVASATNPAGLIDAEPETHNDTLPFALSPAISIVYPPTNSTSLLYMGRGEGNAPKNLWFDSSLFTGIEGGGQVESQPISVSPNPSPGRFAVSFQLPEPRQATLAIYAADGRLVDEIFSGVTSGEDIDVARELPAGVYTVVLRTEDGISSRRVVSL
ncbi:MAG: T9SS type A sorting domain-containing protein [Candidatus Fermentibacteraceae bacterium]